jgi:hypothetical protein
MPFLKGNNYFDSEMALSGKHGFMIVMVIAFALGMSAGWNYPPFQQNIYLAVVSGAVLGAIAYYGVPILKKKFIDDIGIYFEGNKKVTPGQSFNGTIVLSPRIPLENASVSVELAGFLTGKNYGDGVLQIFKATQTFQKISTAKGTEKNIPVLFTISRKEFDAWRNNWINKSPLGGKNGPVGWLGDFYTNTSQAYLFELQVTITNKRAYLPEAIMLDFSPK